MLTTRKIKRRVLRLNAQLRKRRRQRGERIWVLKCPTGLPESHIQSWVLVPFAEREGPCRAALVSRNLCKILELLAEEDIPRREAQPCLESRVEKLGDQDEKCWHNCQAAQDMGSRCRQGSGSSREPRQSSGQKGHVSTKLGIILFFLAFSSFVSVTLLPSPLYPSFPPPQSWAFL